MLKSTVLWIIAIVLTLASITYQRMTGPTHPAYGSVKIGGEKIKYSLTRSATSTMDEEIKVKVPDTNITAQIKFRRYKSYDEWTTADMKREGEYLSYFIPKQPMAGKLAYKVILAEGEREVSLSGDEPILIRFKGHTPLPLLLAHILVIFSAMLFSTRAGLAALDRKSDPKVLAIWTTGLLFVGGFILGPLMQKFAFDAWWTGFPLGKDLTDSKTLFAMLAWVLVLIAGRGGRPIRRWVLAASVLTLIVFLIPHSLLGSELKYTDMTP